MAELDVVTGAFGYTGQYITRRLLASGRRVRTLTGHPQRANPFGNQIEVAPLAFDAPGHLVGSLRGAATLYNTYWVRFAHGRTSFDAAVANTRCLLAAAREAGVRRIVHVSITHPAVESPLPYFRGKALLEQAVAGLGLGYAILRPTVIFGGSEDILINNIAWMLRRLPVFGIPGRGDYRVQPIHVEDLADLAVKAGAQTENVTIDAVGPETYTFQELVRSIAVAVGSRARIVSLPPWAALLACRAVGLVVRDVVLTRTEIAGLMGDLLVSQQPLSGPTRFSAWLREHGGTLGIAYRSELRRHFR